MALIKFSSTDITLEYISNVFGHKCYKEPTIISMSKQGSFGHNHKSPLESANVGSV